MEISAPLPGRGPLVRALSEQVLSALGELLAGFQAARSRSGDAFLADESSKDPSHVYGGLLATLMRLVFLLYAEDHGLLPESRIFTQEYSLTGLYARLRDDDTRHHDTMDQRHGAWSRVLSLFSMVYFGANHRSFTLPARLGELFDPNAYPFLEGRVDRSRRGEHERFEPPRVSDGVVFRVLHALLHLGPARISYRTLDVEQIGSVYEAMMGYTLEPAAGPSFCLKPTEERRRSGSHYTPRELTSPIVRKTLAPVLARLGEKPEGLLPKDILSLKVCDPAMGSGAFLVEACRQLGAALEEAWERRPADKPALPPGDSERTHAKRLVAQRCLYGVDKNPFAVALAKISLWLLTRAKEYPFTFLDHALREGDSLVGLGREQMARLSWAPEKHKTVPLLGAEIERAITRAEALRRQGLWDQAEAAIAAVRRVGDLVIEVFFSASKDKAREKRLRDWQAGVGAELSELGAPASPRGHRPFHWEVEFPEVFSRENPGFDCFVGNPPFFWGNRISRAFGDGYRDWLLGRYEGAHGNSDLVAYFLRRAYDMLRDGGAMGLLATNSIAEAETRTTGLDYVVHHGGCIYEAQRAVAWEGSANVRIFSVFVRRGRAYSPLLLDGRTVERIATDLRETRSDVRPVALAERAEQSFKGVDFGGTGFLLTEQQRESIVATSPAEAPYLWPVLNAMTFTTSPTLTHDAYIINFTGLTLEQAERAPRCMDIVRRDVRPKRTTDKRKAYRERWWLYNEARTGLYQAISGLSRVLVNPAHAKYLLFGFCAPRTVFTNALNVFPFDRFAAFALLQSNVHGIWGIHWASTLEDRLRYTPSTCFETFPFPRGWAEIELLEATGRDVHEHRAALMVRNDEGLTDTYNRFHDPDETDPDIRKLRDLHDAMDRAVLDAYGWSDLRPTCAFLLDSEGARKKKPWRYRFPDDARDEVLARLLALNQERASRS